MIIRKSKKKERGSTVPGTVVGVHRKGEVRSNTARITLLPLSHLIPTANAVFLFLIPCCSIYAVYECVLVCMFFFVLASDFSFSCTTHHHKRERNKKKETHSQITRSAAASNSINHLCEEGNRGASRGSYITRMEMRFNKRSWVKNKIKQKKEEGVQYHRLIICTVTQQQKKAQKRRRESRSKKKVPSPSPLSASQNTPVGLRTSAAGGGTHAHTHTHGGQLTPL
jgi:hypothetical protein